MLENITKDDLKSGMVIKYRNGDFSYVLSNTQFESDLFMNVNKNGWMDFDSYNDDLLCASGNKEFDIVELYKPKHESRTLKFSEDNYELVWKRNYFTKNMLKTGMVIEKFDGRCGMVLLNTRNGDIISGDTWFPFKDYADEELFNDDKGFSIKYIYQPKSNMEYLEYGRIDKDNCTLIWKNDKAND